jgi:adenine phosphoribosyltransferase
MSSIETLKAAIRDVPDFPKKGIVFKDITTLLKDPMLLRASADHLTELCSDRGADKVVAIESRGFIFGAMVADRLGVGLVPVRKPGKLPASTVGVTYELEYGTDSLEMHRDGLAEGERALIVDDLLATGGTARATGQLVERLGGSVCGYAFLIELEFLRGRELLSGGEVASLITY